MTTPTLPSTNGLISNPTARKIIGNIFAWSTLSLLAAGVVDTALPTVDLSAVTIPAAAIVGGLFALFQLTSTSPNVPTPGAITKATGS
jgi:hypothetical protein